MEKLTKELERLLNGVFVRNGTVMPCYEQLVEEIRQLNSKETHILWAGAILLLLREEIKKELLTDEEIIGAFLKDADCDNDLKEWTIANQSYLRGMGGIIKQAQLQKIIKRMEEK